jgi:hypothetical protein
MSRVLPWVIVLCLMLLSGWVAWDLKPPEYREVEVPVEVTLPDTAYQSLKKALEGKIIATDRELVEKYGKRIWKVITKDSLNIIDSLHIDTLYHTIKTLESSDTLNYSGANILNEDTLHVSMRVRVHTLALLEPINAIENNIWVDSIKVSVPPEPALTWKELGVLYWKPIAVIFGIGYLAGK